LEVDTGIAGIDGVISAILRQGEVQDISISDPPLEAIIADIFTAKEEGA
ncbi:MAG TPA: ABC transporter, partial [Firmicutes bacterium]|nr:ABC transporter [Candidatus Fermentithermobacillaceae bacterium]